MIPIPGAKNPSQAADNAGAAGWRMGIDEWLEIERVSSSVRITRVLW